MSFQVEEIVGAYKIVELIGAGGAGQVFKVEHIITRRIEAIKVLSAGGGEGREQRQRFQREIQIQASLSHPNIASVHNAFWAGDDLVMAMELVEGEPLKRILEQGRIPVATALDYICQALSALEYAHAHHVTHRDITPGNMLVTAGGRVKLTDFGLAKSPTDLRLTQTGAVLGSLYYMSPEQVRADPNLDLRTDIYSTGAVLYEMVTGVKPFDGDSAFAIMSAHVGRGPRAPVEIDPALPPALSDIILKALAKDPHARFQSAKGFRAALESVTHTPVPKNPRRVTMPWIIGALAVVLALFLALTAPRSAPSAVHRSASLALPAKLKVEPSFHLLRSITMDSAVWSVALSPSGKWLAAGSENRTIQIWDTLSGEKSGTLRGHAGGIGAVCFSHDEKWLASGSADRTVKLWSLHARSEFDSFRQGGFVTALALSADGRWLVAGSADKKVKLWNLKKGRKSSGFRERHEPRALAFRADGRLLAIAGEDGLKLRSLDNGREVQSSQRPAAALAFAPDGRCLALSLARQSVKLWDAPKAHDPATIDYRGAIRAVAMTNNGRLVAIAGEAGSIAIWAANDRE